MLCIVTLTVITYAQAEGLQAFHSPGDGDRLRKLDGTNLYARLPSYFRTLRAPQPVAPSPSKSINRNDVDTSPYVFFAMP